MRFAGGDPPFLSKFIAEGEAEQESDNYKTIDSDANSHNSLPVKAWVETWSRYLPGQCLGRACRTFENQKFMLNCLHNR
jgi:hypothetical protein